MVLPITLPTIGEPGTEEGGDWAQNLLDAIVALNQGKADIDKLAELLPPIAITDTTPVTSQAAMLALPAQKGDIAIRTDLGQSFILVAEPATTLANWTSFQAAGQVTSVAGKTGIVTLNKGDVGLGNVDDTSDVNKPVSNPQRVAINERVRWTGQWASGKAYVENDWAYTPAGLIVRAKQNHTSAGTAPTIDSAFWEIIPISGGSGSASLSYSNAMAGTLWRVYKTTAGIWPGGTSSTWTRPTNRTDVTFDLVGWAPFPPLVVTAQQGTSVSGMYDGDFAVVVPAP